MRQSLIISKTRLLARSTKCVRLLNMPLSNQLQSFLWRYLLAALEWLYQCWAPTPENTIVSSSPKSLRPAQLKALGIGDAEPPTKRESSGSLTWSIESLPYMRKVEQPSPHHADADSDAESSSAPVALRPRQLQTFLTAVQFAGSTNLLWRLYQIALSL